MSDAIKPLSVLLERNKGHVHMLGVCGVGMAGLAAILKGRGFEVSGCDTSPGDLSGWLDSIGIQISEGHDSSHISDDVEWVVRSSAVPDNIEELDLCRNNALPVYRRGEVLAELIDTGESVAVAGTHGKTTTSSLITQMLKRSDKDVSWCVGADTPGLGVAGTGAGGVIVVEADESDGTLEYYAPNISVVTNIEYDHMEHFESRDAFENCFRSLIGATKDLLVYCADDAGAANMVRDLNISCRVVSYGISDGAGVKAVLLEKDGICPEFLVERDGDDLGVINLPVPGMHNVLNASAAVAVGLEMGLTFEQVRDGLQAAVLPCRRFEKIVEKGGITVISDYAHHPSEVSALIKTAKQHSHDRLLAVYQPHRYSRTRALAEAFAPSFIGLNELVLVPVYPASEQPIKGGMIWDLYDSVRKQGVSECRVTLSDSLDKAWQYFKKELRGGDLLLVIGAGDVEKIAHWAKDEFGKEEDKVEELYLGSSVIKYNENLGIKTTFGVGGNADIWVEVDKISDFSTLLNWAETSNVSINVIGAGSNLLVSDLGVRGIVCRLTGPEFKNISISSNPLPHYSHTPILHDSITPPLPYSHTSSTTPTLPYSHTSPILSVGAAVTIASLLDWMKKNGFCGLEFLEGIPGTIGGAVRMNAGAWGKEIEKNISWIRCLNYGGSEIIFESEDLDWGYRCCSSLSDHFVTSVGICVTNGDMAITVAEREEYKSRRDWMKGLRCAGSVFRNPADGFAGKLIEDAGLKGKTVGGAVVSQRHANIITVDSNATASDVKALVQIIRAEVKEKSGVSLDLEIIEQG